MKTLWRILTKIARHRHGSENIFGYKSTIANQLYLFYCFSGKIYFTDKIRKQFKYLWYGIVSCQIFFSFFIGWAYLWYEAAGNDLVVMLNVANAIGGLLMGAVTIPSISFFFSDSIETTIDRVDDILSVDGISDSRREKIAADAKKNFLMFCGLYVIFLMTFFSVCFLDVVVLFEEAKVKNYLYYSFPVFLIQKYSSIESYFVINGISTAFVALMMFEAWMTLGLLSYWCTVWYSELNSLRDELNNAMSDLHACFGERCYCSKDWNDTFERILKRSIRKFQKIMVLINDLRGFFEVYGTFLIYAAYFYNLFYLYNSFSNDISVVLKVKYVSASLACIVTVFLFYWIGQNLEISVFEITMAIYSTPWYQSVEVRKNVYIFLCQSQSVKTFTIFKVYRLLLNNFSRYVQAVMTYTNMLHKFTKE